MGGLTDAVSDIVSGYIDQNDFEPDGVGYGLGDTQDEAHTAAVDDLPYALDDPRYEETRRITGAIGDQKLSVIAYTTDEEQVEGSGAIDDVAGFEDDELIR